MFAGWSTMFIDLGTSSTELWQYVYKRDDDVPGRLSQPELGRWTLVTSAAGCPLGEKAGCYDATLAPEPLHTCVSEAHEAASGGTQIVCPSARKDAGAWPSPNGAAGASELLFLSLR
jgi:hypothetical protein